VLLFSTSWTRGLLIGAIVAPTDAAAVSALLHLRLRSAASTALSPSTLGDGVLIYFGYLRAHEDDAERAVRAGLAVIEAVGELPAREDPTTPVASSRFSRPFRRACGTGKVVFARRSRISPVKRLLCWPD
jgi:hypothetical protein